MISVLSDYLFWKHSKANYRRLTSTKSCRMLPATASCVRSMEAAQIHLAVSIPKATGKDCP